MNLGEYFATIQGTGILATSDADGNVDIAIYARPYMIDEKTIVFSMLDRLSFKNVKSNHKAAYMFIEQGEGHVGKRLYLTMRRRERPGTDQSDKTTAFTNPREPGDSQTPGVLFSG